jgi:hypothetical protein
LSQKKNILKNYLCVLLHVPVPVLYGMEFQERRSLHVPTSSSSGTAAHGHNSSSSGTTSNSCSHNTNLTSLDLELDLAAQQSRLQVLYIYYIDIS